jgi:hypothetical protein
MRVAAREWAERLASGAARRAAFVTGAAVMFVVFFTSFFTHASGPLDAARTYLIWLQRAGGASPHVHPWWFYFERLGWFRERGGPLWTEIGALALALAGAVVVWRGKGLSETGRKAGRFVVLYAAFLAAIYGVIPYKTPWCLLGFYHPLLLLAGIGLWGIATAGRAWGWKVGAAVIGLAVAGHLTAQAWRASREFAADYRNPYVYAHTPPDLKNLLDLVARVSRASPDGNDTPIQVMVSDSGYWPLPWYWRDREQVGWWDEAHEGPFAPIVIAGSKLGLNLEEKTEGRWFLGGMFELRPRVFVEVYVETGLWKAFLERQRRERG